MDAEKAITLANQYGISTVLCILMMAVLVWVLKWVFDTSREREKSLAQIINVGMTTLSNNLTSCTMLIQEVSRNMKDGFDNGVKADGYNREEHREITRKIDENQKSAENAREKILGAIGDVECKVK